MTKPERNAKQQARRRATGNASTQKYEKTPNGFLMRAYSNAKARVSGVQKERAHIYLGLPIMDREAFYAWARDNPDFWRLFRMWTMAGFPMKLTPSLNRIDPRRGYVAGNVEWVTHSVNSSLARKGMDKQLERMAVRASA